MLHTITKQLEKCIDIGIEISEVDHYRWIFTSTIFRLALEITFLCNKYFFSQMAYELLSQSRELNKRGILIRTGGWGGLEKCLKNNKWGRTLIRDPTQEYANIQIDLDE